MPVLKPPLRPQNLVCFLNRGKTVEIGRIFGARVAAHLRKPEMRPLIQIESPKCTDGKLIPLNKKAGEYLDTLSEILGLPVKSSLPLQNSVFVEKCQTTGKTRVFRKLSGVFPGENVLLNGIVIGKALSSEISIVSENGFIVAIEGGKIKKHGLEKLHGYEKMDPLDLAKAWAKSGNLRRSDFLFSNAQKQNAYDRSSGFSSRLRTGKVVLIDHTAEYAFELAAGAELAVTVGDDTTAIA